MVFNTISGAKFTIYFELRNKIDSSVALTRSYNVDLKAANVAQGGITGSEDKSGGSGVTGGTTNGEEDPSLSPNGGGLSIDWSVDNSINTVKDFFNNAVEFFNLILNFLNQLPSWITIPLYTLFTLAIIIFVYHVIRG